MFCYKCGEKLMDGALFCHRCGTRVPDTEEENLAETVTEVKKTNKELDNKALKIYLSDILTLECALNKFPSDIKDLEYEISNITTTNGIRRYPFTKSNGRNIKDGVVVLRYDGEKMYVMIDNEGYIETAPYSDNSWQNLETLQMGKNRWINYTDRDISLFEQNDIYDDLDKHFDEICEDFKQTITEEYKVKTHTIDSLENKKEKLKYNLVEAKRILNKLYSINIIPEQYRNIYAVYYLHDFISTSEFSLETALLHCDLDEIKVKLDKIINLQMEIIINQAEQEAQNKKLYEQNQRTLEKLSEIEGNTYYAAQYAEIAADNAETVAWLEVVNNLIG